MSNRKKPNKPTVIEEIELSDQDKADLAALNEESPEYHTILQVWRDVLEPAAVAANQKIGPAWAARIVQSYAEVKLSDMVRYRDLYHSKLEDMQRILHFEIATDEQALERKEPVMDREQNAHHYKNLLRDWQLQVLQWEMDWSCEDEDAPLELAAISEIHKMFLSQNGVIAWLDNIGFQFTEADQEELNEALNELKEGHE